MQHPTVLRTVFASCVLCVCAAPLVVAQIRIQEIPDGLTNDRVQTLQQQVSALQQQVNALQLQSQSIGTLQQQVQNLLQDIDMLGVAHQNEKVNTATMISLLGSQVSQMPSQWGQEINQRVMPLEQVLQVSAGGVTLKSTSALTLEAQGTVTLVGGGLTGNVPTAAFSGVVTGKTLIVDSVVASSYTPGAGNMY